MITGKRTYETQSNCNNFASSLKLKAAIQYLAKMRDRRRCPDTDTKCIPAGPNNIPTLLRDYGESQTGGAEMVQSIAASTSLKTNKTFSVLVFRAAYEISQFPPVTIVEELLRSGLSI